MQNREESNFRKYIFQIFIDANQWYKNMEKSEVSWVVATVMGAFPDRRVDKFSKWKSSMSLETQTSDKGEAVSGRWLIIKVHI